MHNAQCLIFNASPSKIDQWSKPRPAAKLVLLLARRSPLMLKERAGGSMKTLTSFTMLIINLFCAIILLRPSGTSSILEEEFS